MSKSRDKRLAIQRAEKPLSERVREWDAINLETILAWADEIAALEAKLDRLRAAIKAAVEVFDNRNTRFDQCIYQGDDPCRENEAYHGRDCPIGRLLAALEEGGDDGRP